MRDKDKDKDKNKSEKFFSASAPLKVSGSFDDFAVAVAPGELVATLVRRYVGLAKIQT